MGHFSPPERQEKFDTVLEDLMNLKDVKMREEQLKKMRGEEGGEMH